MAAANQRKQSAKRPAGSSFFSLKFEHPLNFEIAISDLKQLFKFVDRIHSNTTLLNQSSKN